MDSGNWSGLTSNRSLYGFLKHSAWFRFLLIILIALIAYIARLTCDVYSFSLSNDDVPGDAAVVLGAAVWNGQPSPVFEERIRHAIDLYQSGQVGHIIFTGGIGADDSLPEALVAAAYAIRHGVAEDNVFCESSSKITVESLRGAREIIRQQRFDRILIVSDPMHMRRAITVAQDLGINAFSSPTPTTRYVGVPSKLAFLLQEVVLYGLYLLEKPLAPSHANGQQFITAACF